MRLGARFFGVLAAPRRTFEQVAADPRWFGMLALGAGAVAGGSSLLASAGFAQREMLDGMVAWMEAVGRAVTEEKRADLARQVGLAPWTVFGFVLAGAPAVSLGLAGALQAAGRACVGSTASFRQTFAVVVHAGAAFVVQQLVVVPLGCWRRSLAPPVTLATFGPTLDDDAFAFRLLSAVDPFFLWWAMLLSIGLAVLWGRRTLPIAAAAFAVCAAVAAAAATARTLFGF